MTTPQDVPTDPAELLAQIIALAQEGLDLLPDSTTADATGVERAMSLDPGEPSPVEAEWRNPLRP